MLNFTKAFPRRVARNPVDQELGFGKNLTTQGRMMNPDGSFNVQRDPNGLWDNTYYHLMTISWGMFFFGVFCGYILINLVFATLYLLVGVDELTGMKDGGTMENLMTAFYFSTQTLTTVGYGAISPHGFTANLLASLESFIGLLSFALISGLLYGRFSRPKAKIIFSKNLLVSPFQEGQAMMFRMTNTRRSELIETEVKALVAINQTDDSGNVFRAFFPMPLQVDKISFFSLSWTLVHAINDDSPFFGFSEEDLLESNAEVLVLVKGTDEANQQLVHTRISYTAEEVVWNARFKPVIRRNKRGIPQVITQMIGDYELLET